LKKANNRIRPAFLYLLSLTGLAICIASSIGHEFQSVPVGTPFGLWGVLPLPYWIGIGVMALGMFIGMRQGSETVFFLQTLMLFVAMWGAPALFEKYPTIFDSYMHYYSAVDIARNGFVSSAAAFEYSYNYPGFFALAASYILLGNPPELLFLKLWPLFVAAFTLAAMYLFTRTYVPGLDYRMAFLIVAFVNVWLQFNFSPQSIGLAIGLLIFVCLEREGRAWKFTAVALFSFLVLAHPTTMIFVLGAVFLREVMVRLHRFFMARDRPMRKEKAWPVGAFLLIFLGWYITGAGEFTLNLSKFIAERVQYLGYMGETMQDQIVMRTSADNILGTLYPQIRTLAVGLFGLLTLIAFIVFWYNRRKSTAVGLPKNILPLFFIPLIIIPLDTLFFNGQLYDRGLLYIMLVAPIIFVPILMGKGRRIARPALAAVVAVAVVLVASTLFYQESLYTSSDESMAVSEYLANGVPPTYVVGGYYPYKVWGSSGEDYQRLKYSTVYPEPPRNLSANLGPGTYVFDDTSELWYRQWGIRNMYDYYADQAASNYKVYDNGNYWVMYAPPAPRG